MSSFSEPSQIEPKYTPLDAPAESNEVAEGNSFDYTKLSVQIESYDLRIDPQTLDEEEDDWLSQGDDELRVDPTYFDESEFEPQFEPPYEPELRFSFEDPEADLRIDQARLTPDDEPIERLWLTIDEDLAIPIERSGRLDFVNFCPLEPIAESSKPNLSKGSTLRDLVEKVVELPKEPQAKKSEETPKSTPAVDASTRELKLTSGHKSKSRAKSLGVGETPSIVAPIKPVAPVKPIKPVVSIERVAQPIESPLASSNTTSAQPIVPTSSVEVATPEEVLDEAPSEPVVYPEEEQAEFDRAAAEFDALEEAAFSGDPAALCQLARRYDQGDYVARNARHAFALYYRAALQGYAEAERALGQRYRWGVGVAPSRRRAFYWFRESARHGDVESRRQLGLAYANGWGVKPDLKRAARAFYLAAQAGDLLAEFAYGQALLYGRGVERDVAQGLATLERAAQRGLQAASIELNAWERVAAGKETRGYSAKAKDDDGGKKKRKQRRIDAFHVKDASDSGDD